MTFSPASRFFSVAFVGVMGAGIAWCSNSLRPAKTSESAPAASLRKLDLTESIGAAFFEDGEHWSVYRRADPASKRILWRILEDDALIAYHPHAVHILGYVGDGTDALRLWNVLSDGRFAAADGKRMGRAIACFFALGIQCRRGIPEARDIVRRMMDAEVWRQSKLRWHLPVVPELLLPHEEALRWAYPAYRIGFGRHPFEDGHQIPEDLTREREQLLLVKTTSPEFVEDLVGDFESSERRLPRADERQILLMLCGRHRSWLRGQGFDSADMEVSSREAASLTTEREATERTATVREKQDDPAPTGPVPVPEPEAGMHYQEALAEFWHFRDQMIEEKYDEVMKRVADNGKPLGTRGDDPRLRNELVNDLRRERNAMERLKGSAVVPRLLDCSARIIPTNGGSGRKVVEVRILFAGSREIGKELGSIKRPSTSVSEDGSLIGVMIRVEGTWYWNPFGW